MPLGSTSVEQIKERLDIAEVLSEYVKLIPSGPSRFKVLCPFHHEKTPSLMVSKDRQTWHCFGCGKGGDMFTFVQEIESAEFPEALRMLAKKANVELKPINPELHNAKTRLLDILKLTAAFYRKVLTDAEGAGIARSYLAKRKVSDETAEDFLIGYSPTTWDATLTFLTKKGFREQEVFDAGLTVRREKGVGYYDRFRGRLMFPIRDVSGMVVGFGGRALEEIKEDPSSGAKYINTPETLVYQKSRVLYGLDVAKQAIKSADLAVLVEGYMDLITSHQAGVKNVIAVSGTALTVQQVKLLKRYTSNIALAFDADLAGGEAARRGIDQALNADMRVTVISFSGAKDPDELIQQDPAKWRNAIATAERIVEYSFNRALANADLSDVDVKKRIAKQLLPVIARLPDPIEQSHYLQSLSAKLSVDEETLRDALKKRAAPKRAEKGDESAEQPLVQKDRATLVSEQALALAVFLQPKLFPELSEQLEPDMIPDHDLRALYRQALLYYSQSHTIDIEGFSEYLSKELPLLKPRFEQLILLSEHIVHHEADGDRDVVLRRELGKNLVFLRRLKIVTELKTIEEELRRVEAAGSDADPLLKRMDELTDELRTLDK
ncbi:MAG: DNA primase [Candidatus Kerfeldbacteria bacterium]